MNIQPKFKQPGKKMLKNIKSDFLKVLLDHALDFEETLQIFKSLFTAYTT